MVASAARRAVSRGYATAAANVNANGLPTSVKPSTLNESLTWNEILLKNQRIYNQQTFPSTPISSGQKTLIKVSNAIVNVTYVVGAVALGLTMSTGLWAPYVINRNRAKIEKKYEPLVGEIN